MSFYDSAFTRDIYNQSRFILFLQFSTNLNPFCFLINQLKLYFFKSRWRLFYFCVCSLRPIHYASVHFHGHPDLSFASFWVQLVRACSPTCPECPSLNSSLSVDSFPIICPKGSCFSLVALFHRPTHLFLHVLLLARGVLYFRKLPFHTPPLSQL